MTPERRPLTGREIAVVKHLAMYCGVGGVVTLSKRWQREAAARLWRLLLVEVWYRQSPTRGAESQGPFYGLTDRGKRLASTLFTEPQPSRRQVVSRQQTTTAPPSGVALTKENDNAHP